MKQDISGIKAVIFDVDGTLYRGGIAFGLILGDIRNCFLALNERKVRNTMKEEDFGDGDAFYREFFKRLSARTGKTEEQLRVWYFEKYMPLMVSVISKNKKAQRSVNNLFETLHKKGIKIIVYSDYTKSKEKLDGLGINTSLVSKFYCAEEMGALKPQPRPFKEICEEFSILPNEALMIGDRPDTDGGAVEAGMKFICLEGKKTKKIERDKIAYDIIGWEELCDLLIMN